MAEYIEKQAATMIPVLPKEHREYQTMNLDDAYENGWYDALKCVEKLPPADVRPVRRGRWTSDGDGYHWVYVCSVCSWKDGYPFNERHNFCPNCGSYNGGDNSVDE